MIRKLENFLRNFSPTFWAIFNLWVAVIFLFLYAKEYAITHAHKEVKMPPNTCWQLYHRQVKAKNRFIWFLEDCEPKKDELYREVYEIEFSE